MYLLVNFNILMIILINLVLKTLRLLVLVVVLKLVIVKTILALPKHSRFGNNLLKMILFTPVQLSIKLPLWILTVCVGLNLIHGSQVLAMSVLILIYGQATYVAGFSIANLLEARQYGRIRNI